MKTSPLRPSVASLLAERLAALGAANLPASARLVIEADLFAALASLIQRRVTAPAVGRAVARALAAPTAIEQGFKGGTPLTSSPGRTPSAQPDVAGHLPDTSSDTTAETPEPPTGERL
jgi:hypothetical protein